MVHDSDPYKKETREENVTLSLGFCLGTLPANVYENGVPAGLQSPKAEKADTRVAGC